MIEAPRHDLDEAIDRVAAKLVAASDDDGLLPQVMARLPERGATSWFLTVPSRVAAALALVLLAFLYARPAREVVPPGLLVVEHPSAAALPLGAVPHAATAPIPDPRSRIPDPRSLIPDPRSLIDRSDHEFSLPPVDALEAIELSALTTPALELAATPLFAPLVLTDLPLASDVSSPHQR